MFNDSLKNLRQLNETAVPEDALDRGRIKLMAYMVSHPMLKTQPRLSWLGRTLVWKPMTAAVVAGAVLCGAGGAVYAAGSALPGERLYPVKLLAEEVRARLAVSADAKFQVTAQRAEDRLSEAEELMNEPQELPAARQKRLAEAMRRYQENVKTMNALAAQFESDEGKPEKAVAAELTVERVLDRHATLVDSASATIDEKTEETIVAPIQPTLELETRVLNALSAQFKFGDRVHKKAESLRQRLQNFEQKHRAEGAGASGEVLFEKPAADTGENRNEHHDDEHTETEAAKIPVNTDVGADFKANADGGINAQTDIQTNSMTTAASRE